MRKIIIIVIIATVGLAGCALFGIFSFSKNGDKEIIEMRRIRQAEIVEELILDPVTLQNIQSTWENLNTLWIQDLDIYVERYGRMVAGGVPGIEATRIMFDNIIRRTITIKNLSLPLNLNVDDFGAVLAFPEGVEYSVYWFVFNGGFPLLGFSQYDLHYLTVP